MLETIKVSSRGQVVIPESVRKNMNIEEGTKLVLLQNNNKIILEKEKDFLKEVYTHERERKGWMMVAEKNLAKLWNNSKDEEEWSKYL
ncbi:AbrB/MazE/SpoVT family DNA-binding domain-containing protein [Candidatus Woesearchaeota archaeon]|jgi:AbrB family looped-hinge helix DNA binding protein|nr:AbrB/MazE/SpoVT family DNA-binding domain-containing protein [Candidatus Woesearchaeota archaeon]